MATNPRVSNGHRRRQLRNRLLATATQTTCPWPHCPWPGQPFDPTLGNQPGTHSRRCTTPHCPGCVPDPRRPEVDELIPVSRGGDPLSRDNTRLMHRWCNQQKGNGTRNPTPQAPATVPWTTAW